MKTAELGIKTKQKTKKRKNKISLREHQENENSVLRSRQRLTCLVCHVPTIYIPSLVVAAVVVVVEFYVPRDSIQNPGYYPPFLLADTHTHTHRGTTQHHHRHTQHQTLAPKMRQPSAHMCHT